MIAEIAIKKMRYDCTISTARASFTAQLKPNTAYLRLKIYPSRFQTN